MRAGRPEEASSSGEDEAEFAWLPMDCLKPFQPSDAGAVPSTDGPISDNDANLRACVAAANKAVLAQQSRLDERNAAAAAAGGKQLVAEEDSDSDGGAFRRLACLPLAVEGFCIPDSTIDAAVVSVPGTATRTL